MRIHNIFLTSAKVGSTDEAPSTGEAGGQAKVADQSSPEASRHTPSAELAGLINLVKQEAEVRLDVVNQVKQRLAAGDYLTPAAARRTARALQDNSE